MDSQMGYSYDKASKWTSSAGGDVTEYLLRSPKNAQRLAQSILSLERSLVKARQSAHPTMSPAQCRRLVRLAGRKASND
ncbi:MAG: hypothetical protein A3G75_08910 [Verrucomicrobia bacterium RIFCSPLOWO2_12_FULL_64_8]|nr:MAG: hypothetical protein A3G75_08910 [Verrucomicrobia bacterium RIFCSPLOWO2_12_FULL_64_8]